MTAKNNERLLTTSKVAEFLHLHQNTVRRWSDKGVIKSYRIGSRGDRRFRKQDINEFLEKYSSINS
jgi:excisionase family DNA binding protein